MNVEVSAAQPAEVDADVVVLPAGGLHVRRLDAVFDGRLARAAADADPIAVLPVTRELRARRVAVVSLDESHPDGLRTAVARAVRAQSRGATVAWALDDWLALALERQVQAIVEGAVLASYDPGRWKSERATPRVGRFVVCSADEKEHRDVAARAELGARWTNVA